MAQREQVEYRAEQRADARECVEKRTGGYHSVTCSVCGFVDRKELGDVELVDAVLREVVAQGALADPHVLCGVFLHPS